MIIAQHIRRGAVVITATVVAIFGAVSVAPSAGADVSVRHACPAATARTATCFAVYQTGPAAAVAGAAVTPAIIQAAYHLSPTAGAGQVVGIVDAHDDPKAEADLAAFRSAYGLPACTTANGCFRKVNQRGVASPLPAGDQGWGLEISLDLDAVSAACPACKILLVEGDSAGLNDLGTAVNTAVRLGAKVVSNSYGMNEFAGMTSYANKYYVHATVPIVASSGDAGFGPASFPAVLSNVIAVGGTSLHKAAGTARGWKETVWNSASSGCSVFVAKPAWQRDPSCAKRTVADVSADADPATGLLVRDSYGYPGTVQVGGTSMSAPIIAAIVAAAGHTTTVHNASGIYSHPTALYDVVSGSNGSCGGGYLCTGKVGYDAPTGVGTPNGTGAL